jgi:hypothetical protein
MLYESHEDEFDQEDQALLDKIAARYTVAPQAKTIALAQPNDPWQDWIAERALLFGKCLAGVSQHLPEVSQQDRLHAAEALFRLAAGKLELIAA